MPQKRKWKQEQPQEQDQPQQEPQREPQREPQQEPQQEPQGKKGKKGKKVKQDEGGKDSGNATSLAARGHAMNIGKALCEPRMAAEESPPNDPFLGSIVRIVVSDERVLTGTMVEYDGHGNCVLEGVTESRAYEGPANTNRVASRVVALSSVPFKHIVSMAVAQPLKKLPGALQ